MSTGTSALPSSVNVLASRTRRKVLFSCTREQIWVPVTDALLRNYMCIWCYSAVADSAGLHLLFWA